MGCQMPTPIEMSPDRLLRLIGLPDRPAIIDVRTDEDFAADPRLIPGSVRRPAREPDSGSSAAGNHAVVVCQMGLKLSHGAAAGLRLAGIGAVVLEGGYAGWAARGLPLIPETACPEGSTWVTAHRPGIVGIACAWLIRRFLDRDARFLFVPVSEVLTVAARFDAVAFDVAGAAWSGGDNDLTTFDKMIAAWGLATPELERLAAVFRTDVPATDRRAAETAGLAAVMVGLSRRFSGDLDLLDAGLAVLDALYRWSRDAQEEDVDWSETYG